MTITLEQQQALDALLARMLCTDPQALKPDLLQGLIGLSGAELQQYFSALLGQKDGLEQWALEAIDRNPLEASFQFLSLAAVAFYQAEKGQNPKVKTLVDAFYFISTCASVGYADIFPVTQMGRATASLVMTVGPALMAKALEKAKS